MKGRTAAAQKSPIATSDNEIRYPGDLRAWLSTVHAAGELKRISGADSNHEVGEITEINNAVVGPKALLFEVETGRVLTCGGITYNPTSDILTGAPGDAGTRRCARRWPP